MVSNYKVLKIIVISLMLFFAGCTTRIIDLELNKDPNLYAGVGEICENSYIKVNCRKDLDCKTVTTNPYIIKVCYPYDEALPEDFVYKNNYDNAVYVEYKNISNNNS